MINSKPFKTISRPLSFMLTCLKNNGAETKP
jgi:hypothetical protein